MMMRLTIVTAKTLLIAMLCLPNGCEKKTSLNVPTESREERAADILDAFSDTSASNEPDFSSLKSLNVFFHKVGKTFASGDGKQLEDVFDIGLTYEMLKSQKAIPPNSSLIPEKVTLENQRLADQFVKLGFFWDVIEIKKVKPLSKDIVIVYTRHWNQDDTITKFGWWVKRTPETWNIFDYNDLATNVRFSTTFAETQNQHLRSGSKAPDPHSVKFLEFIRSVNSTGEYDLQAISEIDPSRLPRSLRPTYYFFLACALVEESQPQKARTEANRAQQLDPDFPAIYLLLAEMDLMEEKFESALNNANQYAAFLGKDADFYYAVGRMYQAMGKHNEAIEVFEKGLKDDPKGGHIWICLLQSSEPDATSHLIETYSKLDDVEQWVVDIAYWLGEEQDKQSLLLLQKIHRSVAPNDEDGLKYVQRMIDYLTEGDAAGGHAHQSKSLGNQR